MIDIKKMGVILLILSIFFSVGCNIRQSDASTPDKYHVGNDGLKIKFMTGTPPTKVYENDDLTVVVEVTNKGAYPTSDSGHNFDGKIFIGGFDSSYIAISPTSVQLDSGLYGKDQYNDEGTYDTETFTATSVSLPDETDSYNPNLQISACYKYKTYASPVVCIDPDPYSSELEDEVCTVRDQSLSGGQGAPVAVTKVEESVTKDQVKFKIHFRNVGDGWVIDPDYINSDCPDTDRENLNKVDVNVRLSGAQASCKPQNPVHLVNGAGYVVCDTQKPSESTPAYTTPLLIELTYGYSTSISTKVSIVNE